VAARDSADAGSIRNAIRWGLLLASVGTAGFRLPRLVNEYRSWREALWFGDTSASEGWHRVLAVELVGVLVVVAIGTAAFYALRPKAKASE
jgi:hypothetical protein